MLSLLVACRSNKSQEVKFEKKEKAPRPLVNIAKSIQEILTETEELEKLLDGTYIDEMSLSGKEDKSGHGGHGSEESGSKGASEGEKDKEGNEKKEGQDENENKPKSLEEKQKEEEEKRQEIITHHWQAVSKKIESVHKDWNSYETEEKKGSLSLEKIDQFRTSINNLTIAIENKDIMKIYEYGSQSLLNISPMFDLYKDDMGGEINRIKHGIYFAYLKFLEDKVLQGTNSLKQLESNINNLKLKLGDDKDKIKLVDKISAAIEDMEKAMRDGSLKLIRIKRDIVIENIEELE